MTQLNLLGEKTLVKKIKASNSKAYKEVFTYYYPRVVSYFYTRISDFSTSEDLAQQVFISVWNSREKLDEHRKFSSYVFTIAKNTLIDYFRKKTEVNIEIEENALIEIPADSEDTISEKIMSLLNHVSETHRVTFLLHRLDGLSYKEISDCFDISVKAVEKRVSTVLKYLRSKL